MRIAIAQDDKGNVLYRDTYERPGNNAVFTLEGDLVQGHLRILNEENLFMDKPPSFSVPWARWVLFRLYRVFSFQERSGYGDVVFSPLVINFQTWDQAGAVIARHAIPQLEGEDLIIGISSALSGLGIGSRKISEYFYQRGTISRWEIHAASRLFLEIRTPEIGQGGPSYVTTLPGGAFPDLDAADIVAENMINERESGSLLGALKSSRVIVPSRGLDPWIKEHTPNVEWLIDKDLISTYELLGIPSPLVGSDGALDDWFNEI